MKLRRELYYATTRVLQNNAMGLPARSPRRLAIKAALLALAYGSTARTARLTYISERRERQRGSR